MSYEALHSRWRHARERVATIATQSRSFFHAGVIGLLGGGMVFLVMPPFVVVPRTMTTSSVSGAAGASGVGAEIKDLYQLVRRCAPTIAPGTMLAIMRTESGFRPWALNVNGTFRLQRAPRSAAEAISWSSWLIAQGHSVDMGLMQINSRNLPRLNLTPATVFEPCQNVRAAAAILGEQYSRAALRRGVGNAALLEAISAYNTGNFRDGFRNGYVDKVVTNASVR